MKKSSWNNDKRGKINNRNIYLSILTIIIIILLIVLGSPSYKNTFIIHNSGELEVSRTGDGNRSYKQDDKIPDNIFNNSLIHVIGNMDLTYSSSIISVTNTSTVAKFKVNNDISISKISSAKIGNIKIGNIIINPITNDEVKIYLSLTQFINIKNKRKEKESIIIKLILNIKENKNDNKTKENNRYICCRCSINSYNCGNRYCCIK